MAHDESVMLQNRTDGDHERPQSKHHNRGECGGDDACAASSAGAARQECPQRPE